MSLQTLSCGDQAIGWKGLLFGTGVSGVDVIRTGLWLVEKNSMGRLKHNADLEMQTFPMKSSPSQTWRHQRIEEIIIVCVSYSIPLPNTLSQRPLLMFSGHRRSNASSRTRT